MFISHNIGISTRDLCVPETESTFYKELLEGDKLQVMTSTEIISHLLQFLKRNMRVFGSKT